MKILDFKSSQKVTLTVGAAMVDNIHCINVSSMRNQQLNHVLMSWVRSVKQSSPTFLITSFYAGTALHGGTKHTVTMLLTGCLLANTFLGHLLCFPQYISNVSKEITEYYTSCSIVFQCNLMTSRIINRSQYLLAEVIIIIIINNKNSNCMKNSK